MPYLPVDPSCAGCAPTPGYADLLPRIGLPQPEDKGWSEGMLADRLPPRRNRGRKVAKIEVAARSLLNHRVGKGLGTLEMVGLGFPNHIHNPTVGS